MAPIGLCLLAALGLEGRTAARGGIVVRDPIAREQVEQPCRHHRRPAPVPTHDEGLTLSRRYDADAWPDCGAELVPVADFRRRGWAFNRAVASVNRSTSSRDNRMTTSSSQRTMAVFPTTLCIVAKSGLFALPRLILAPIFMSIAAIPLLACAYGSVCIFGKKTP
jgi:hypothetical protein